MMIAQSGAKNVKKTKGYLGSLPFIGEKLHREKRYKKIKWVIMPLLGCATSVIIMIGLLGLIGWKVTVISSNFIALMLILTMAMNIHMSTRFLQLKKNFPTTNNFEIISLTTSKMFWPILYTVLTTILAFLSLIFNK